MKILALLSLVLSVQTFSFVENTTKGYANCMACHISPNGGGVLTDYGRSLSSSLMSTWKVTDGFENPYYGLGKNTQNIKFGGQYRMIQVYAENDQIDVKRQFTMQNNLEFAVKYMNAFVVGTVGTQEGPDNFPDKNEFLSERHFALWEVSPDSRLRVGKFRQHFGINHPNHTRFTKASLGFGSNSETYNFEFSKFFETGEINTSASLGKIFTSDNRNQGKRNLVFNYTYYANGSSRIGTSLLYEKSNTYKRSIYGLNAIFPILKNGIGRSEINFENKSLGDTTNGYQDSINALYGDHQYGLKAFKGGMAYFIFEHSQSNLSDSKTLITSPGVGFQFLPIPHVEIQLEYQRRTYKSDPNNKEHRSFITAHLYH